jgi:SAM-dependent methyltransferase
VRNRSSLLNAEVVALFLGDLIRELTDKALLVLLALIFVKFMGFIPDTLEPDAESSQMSNQARFSTDAFSILIFTFTCAVYLLAARIFTPTIIIRPQVARFSIYWLREPQVLALLFAPVVLSIIAFLLLSYGPDSIAGRRLDAKRRRRESLYHSLTSPTKFSPDILATSEVFRLLKADGVYGLLFTVLLWPSKESVLGGTVNSILIYFGVMAAFAGVFFFHRREFSRSFGRAYQLLTTLHGWLVLRDSKVNSSHVFTMFAELFKDDLQVSASGVKRHGPISYLPAVVIAEKGYVYEITRDQPGRRLLLIVAEKPGNIDTQVHESIDELLEATGINVAMVLTLSPVVPEKSSVRWLKYQEEKGRTVLLVAPEDVEDAIYESTRNNSSQLAFTRGRIHVSDSLVGATKETGLTIEDGAQRLAERALPYVAHVLQTMRPGSSVLDLGAGRGRHVIAALKRGHRVFAIERNQKACADMRSFVSQIGGIDCSFDVLCEDYLDTDPETVGLVDFVIITGVLQHTTNPADLRKHLRHIREFTFAPYSRLCIEMLFDMRMDGRTPTDGRFDWSQAPFEEILAAEFPPSVWTLELVRGPTQREQCFADGARSFIASAKRVSSTSVEYLISREC